MSPPYQELPPELRQALDQHALWLKKGGKPGKPASLTKHDFQGLNLANAVLEQANLEGANFKQANLAGANLKRTNLRESSFVEADLTEADFHDADLEQADLTGSKGLSVAALARANLTDCRLPGDLQKFSGLDYIKEASGITSSLFTAMLIACGYAGITAFTTSDVSLLTNAGTTSLPLLGVGINMAAFYATAPLLLLATYIYFHLNLGHLWENLVTLPAIFPDGQRLDQKAYPWLFNWVPSIYFPQTKRLKNLRFGPLQKFMAAFLAWYFVPLTLVILWFRYLYVRNFWITLWHLALLTVTAAFGFRFRDIAMSQLREKNGSKPGTFILQAIRISVVFIGFLGISDGFIYGVPATLEPDLAPPVGWYFERQVVPDVLNLKPWHLAIVVNFEEAEVSRKIGDSQTTDAREEVLAAGAPLKGKNLRCAYAKGAFLAKADLRAANLELAYLRAADLRSAKLGESGYPKLAANLPKAFLFQANLSNACLFQANLYRTSLEAAILKGVNLEQAVLAEANLRYANLAKAKMTGTILRAANLQGANLRGAEGLEVKQVREARAWMLAYYDGKIFADLGLSPDHNVRLEKLEFPKQNKPNQESLDLQTTDLVKFNCAGASLKKANLWKADLRDANLSGADLREANLGDANLSRTNFHGAQLEKVSFINANLWRADFQGAMGLNADQLRKGKNWTLALYDPEMTKQLNLPPEHNLRVLANRLDQYDLAGADLKGSYLAGATFQGADLREADLSWSELRRVNLHGANLSGANLTGTYLGYANLQGADLHGAILEQTNLEGADLTGAKGFTSGQLRGAKVNSETKLP
jgi:uncharacterized protein YjbI with pentapeptide repeats